MYPQVNSAKNNSKPHRKKLFCLLLTLGLYGSVCCHGWGLFQKFYGQVCCISAREETLSKIIVVGIVSLLLLIGFFSLAFNIQPAHSEAHTITVPDDYPTIGRII